MIKSLTTTLVIILATCSFTASHAQLTNVAMTADSSFVVDKVYAGMLAGTVYNPETEQFNNFINTRVGGSVYWKIANKLTWCSWAYAEYEALGQTATGFQTSYLQYTPTKKWLIDAGIAPTLVALQHRPNPISRFGQFEPPTKTNFPGSAPTVQVRYLPTDKLMFGGGVSIRKSKPEYQITTTIGAFQASAFYQEFSHTTGLGFSYTKGRFGTTTIWKSDNIIANVSTFMMHRKQQLMIYSDFGYTLPSDSVSRFEVGLIKLVDTKYLKSIIGIGYEYRTGIRPYLLMSL